MLWTRCYYYSSLYTSIQWSVFSVMQNNNEYFIYIWNNNMLRRTYVLAIIIYANALYSFCQYHFMVIVRTKLCLLQFLFFSYNHLCFICPLYHSSLVHLLQDFNISSIRCFPELNTTLQMWSCNCLSFPLCGLKTGFHTIAQCSRFTCRLRFGSKF